MLHGRTRRGATLTPNVPADRRARADTRQVEDTYPPVRLNAGLGALRPPPQTHGSDVPGGPVEREVRRRGVNENAAANDRRWRSTHETRHSSSILSVLKAATATITRR